MLFKLQRFEQPDTSFVVEYKEGRYGDHKRRYGNGDHMLRLF